MGRSWSKATKSAAMLAAMAWATSARADDVAGGKVLFDRGLAAMKAGDFAHGCPSIEASYKLDPRLGTLFTLAECEAKLGKIATALARYDAFLAAVGRLPPEYRDQQEERRKIAATQRAALAGRVAMLTVVVPSGAPSNTVVKQDDAEVSHAAQGIALPVDAGTHIISSEVPGGTPTSMSVSIVDGERKTVTVPMPQIPARGGIVASTSPQRIASYAMFGVGGLGLVLGAVMGGLAVQKKGVVNAHCNFPGDPYGCDEVGLAASSDLKTFGTVSTVGFVIAGAGVGTGLALFFTEPKAKTPARAAMIGVSGAW